MKKYSLSFYFLISFVEGGMMLLTELASSRKMAVFFGSSLYVWLIILCITMIGLATGYYWANQYLMKKNSSEKTIRTLSFLFLILSFSLILWKFNNSISLFFIQNNFGLITSVILDALFLLAVPMFIYGSLTTLLLYITQTVSSQPVYGKILAVSTLGSVVLAVAGVIFAFPYLGVQNTISILSILSLLMSIIIYATKATGTLIIFVLLAIYPEKKMRGNVLYQNDGAFSSVMVVKENDTRYLLVNYIIQSFEDNANKKTLPYVEVMDSVLKQKQINNKKVLILGLGGGIIANRLATYQKNITGVEIDARIIKCAKEFFNLNKKVTTICEDAQWFIQHDTNQYHIIIMDMFNGEEPPAYILNYENLNGLRKKLCKDTGLLIINWYGYYSNEIGKGTRVFLNTLVKTGFRIAAIPTTASEKNSNLVIFASENVSLLPANKIHLMQDEELVNTSERNILSFLNAKANYHWRKDYLFFIQHWWR